MIILNWKSSFPSELNSIFSLYEKLSKKYDIIVFPPENHLECLLKKFSIKFGLQYLANDKLDLVKYVMLNHQDFKKKYSELDKAEKILNLKKTPIICFSQLEETKSIKIAEKYINKYIWAYEPEGVIGSLKSIDLHIIKRIKENFTGKGKFLYGGGVNHYNILDILNITDGVLIGRRSADIRFMQEIVDVLL